LAARDRIKSVKKRADVLLVEGGHADSRARARALILSGAVFAGEQRINKAGDMLAADTGLAVRRRDHPWVSRGGVKLAHGLETFGIGVKDRVGLDIGASTGGFCDVLLAAGARRVYAVDVGYGQLAWKLRQDDRVVVLERTNARYLGAAEIPEPVEIIVCDASFISLKKVLPAGLALAAGGARLIALIKPQFEVGKGQVGKGGVVRDAALRQQVCDDIGGWLTALPGWSVEGICESPITGPKGNVEYLIAGRYTP